LPSVSFFHTQEKNFSNVIYKDLYNQMIDIHDIAGTYVMCHFDTLKDIAKRIAALESQIYYLGNGNYHYLSLALLEKIKEPFSLVLFDHHHDAGYLPVDNVTSCGTWVKNAIEEIELLQHVYIIGGDTKNKKEPLSHVSLKITIVSENDLSVTTLKKLTQKIETSNIYVSIDRDFLSEREVLTNWDQGNASLDDLLQIIQIVCKNHRLLGADVCGDILWDYPTMTKHTMQASLKRSVTVNEQIFNLLKELLKETE